MLKNITSFLLLLFFVQVTNAQFLWLEDETNTRKIEFTAEEDVPTNLTGNFANPHTSGINTHAIVSKYNRPAGTSDFLSFNLFNYVTDLTDYTVTLKAYIDIPTEELTSSNSKLRIFFWSSDEGSRTYEQLRFTVGQEWETFTFHFQDIDVPQNVLDVGGYDLMVIGLANGSTEIPATTYYFDEIYGSTDQTATTIGHPAEWLAGSWGATFPVWGGERLDTEVADGHDAIGGVQELVTELPEVGHVITNLSYFAHSHYFTIRDNTNVDVATEIDESLVPSAENQEIILEVLQTLKNSGKKIILYISTNYLNRASDETQAAWTAYYTANFGGDEYLAYKDLVQGFIPAVAEYADGYWFDTTSVLRDDGYLEDFVQMFKDADPGAAMSVSEFGHLHYIEGEQVTVDSDSVNDEDERDYNVTNFRGNNSYSDFTRGHVSSLGGGAPPNSWGYEEFTIPAMVGNPWSMFEKKQSLKHAWFPIRASWHGTRSDLIFGIEDAYRFSKILIDAKAGVTFANTVSSTTGIAGYMTPDEMVIMKAINDRLLSNPVPDYEPYVRPEGAYLVSETLNTWGGSSDSNWTTNANWSKGNAPTLTDDVIIPTGLTNYPTIATDVTVNNVSLVDEASLLFSGTGALTTTTSVIYERTIDANKWYLMSSPVVGESYDDDWITANGIASGQGSNRGIGYYDNTSSDEQTGHWRYFQSGGNATAFNSGQGYSIIRSTAGAVTFTGSGVYTTSQTKAISQSVSNFSLVSNPFTGYLNLGDFFTDNNSANLLANNTIYVWNAVNDTYDTKVSEFHSSYEIAHGQAFFVEAGTVGGTLNFDINDVTHQGGSDTFQKTSNTFSKIYITLSDENSTNRSAEIYFIEGATTGFDNGYDGELFGGASHSFALFSELLEDNGKNYQIQSLPTSLKQSAIIPLGLIANKGLEINISTEIENLPLDVFVYLEDREKGTFTLLNDNASFNFTTEETLNGKGRFYLHTSAKALSTVNETLKNVSIYKLDNTILKIKGLSQGEANIKLFDTFGKQLMNNSFDSNGSQQQINLPKLATGIYIVQLNTDVGTLNKKIFLE